MEAEIALPVHSESLQAGQPRLDFGQEQEDFILLPQYLVPSNKQTNKQFLIQSKHFCFTERGL
jgi:hypothetical protein